MTHVYSTAQAQQIDSLATDLLGIPSLVLMENAARGACDVIVELGVELSEASVVIACGRGNNGGDGLALARQMMIHGADVLCVIVDAREHFSSEARAQLAMIEALDPDALLEFADIALVDAREFDVVVDALLGTGSKGAPRNDYAHAVDWLNERAGLHIALDIPTGLDGDTGLASEPVFIADTTVTMAALKTGLMFNDGVDVAGSLYTVHIGIPPAAYPPTRCWMLDAELARDLLPLVESTRHKYDRGRVLVIGGSRGMTGAPTLTAEASLRTGAGLTVLALPQQTGALPQHIAPEILTRMLGADDNGAFRADAFDALRDELTSYDAIAIGPGLSKSSEAASAVAQLVKNATVPIVLDADGLAGYAGALEHLTDHVSDLVITPHHGEMARLAKLSVEEIASDPIGVARDVAVRTNAVVVLKGAPTVVAVPDGRAWINSAGNPGMASGGTGDVLTGVIASLIAQGTGAEAAALAGVFLHSRAADLAIEATTEGSLIASDIIRSIAGAYRELTAVTE